MLEWWQVLGGPKIGISVQRYRGVGYCEKLLLKAQFLVSCAQIVVCRRDRRRNMVSRSYQFVFPICFRTKDMEEMAFFDHPNVNVPALARPPLRTTVGTYEKPPKHVLHRPPWRFLVLNFLEAGLL